MATDAVKFMEFPVRLPALSRRDFHLYWQRHHSPHVMNVTPFAQYIRKYMSAHVWPGATPGLPAHYGVPDAYEGASELWLNSLADVGDWLGHPLYAELIQPDEVRFLLQDGSGAFIIAREERIHVPDEDLAESNLTKLYLLVKRRPGLDPDAGHAAISAHAQRFVASPGLRARVRKLTVSHKLAGPLPEGFVLADIDAVLELWFDDRAALAAFFQEPDYLTLVAPHEVQAMDAGAIRAVVGKLRVIHDEYSFQPTTTQPFPFSWDG